MREEALIALARCGAMETSILVNSLGLTEVDLVSLEEEKLLKKQVEIFRGDNVTVLYLTDIGEIYVKNKIPQVNE